VEPISAATLSVVLLRCRTSDIKGPQRSHAPPPVALPSWPCCWLIDEEGASRALTSGQATPYDTHNEEARPRTRTSNEPRSPRPRPRPGTARRRPPPAPAPPPPAARRAPFLRSSRAPIRLALRCRPLRCRCRCRPARPDRRTQAARRRTAACACACACAAPATPIPALRRCLCLAAPATPAADSLAATRWA
jgi:hypothetical protein